MHRWLGTAAWSTVVSLGACGAPAGAEPDPSSTSGHAGSTASVDTGAPQPSEGSSSTNATGGDVGSTTVASTGLETGGSSSGPDEVCTPVPAADATWIADAQDELVARLSGAMPLPSGETLSDRSSGARRAETANYLFDELEALGLQPQFHEYVGEAAGTNVFAHLPATAESSAFWVVGAHYDTVVGSPGANDNATGVALVLSLARYLTSLPCRQHNVAFAFFDQEEIGLVGSFEFARLLDDNGLDVIAVHTVDQMGWDQDGDRTVELERADAGLLEFYQDTVARLASPVPLSPTETGFTDHVSFRTWGFDAVGLTEEFVGGDTTPHYHLSTDGYETVDLDYLRSTTVLVHAAFARALAP